MADYGRYIPRIIGNEDRFKRERPGPDIKPPKNEKYGYVPLRGGAELGKSESTLNN